VKAGATLGVLVLVSVAAGASGSLHAQQPRDGRAADPGGTAQISGVVVTADRTSKPLRRARVSLIGGELSFPRTVISTDEGTFAFHNLPPGRYSLNAAKDGFVPMAFGATRPNRPGGRVVVAAGEQRSISLALPPGAVITGTLTTRDGQPLPGIAVNAMIYRFFAPTGERRLLASGAPAAVTDDRGEYRLFGLPAGEYAISAHLRSGPGLDFGGELQEISAAEVRRALIEVRDLNRRVQPVPGTLGRAAPVGSEPRRSVVFAPAYYPGTAMAALAKFVTVAAGEQRQGIDFSVEYVPTAKVTGFVVLPGGPQQASVTMVRDGGPPGAFDEPRSSRTGADGSFTLTNVPPGTYTILARTGRAAASTQITVDGEELDGVTITMQPGITIAGRVMFHGSGSKPPDLPSLRIPMPTALVGGTMAVPIPPVQLEADGRFEIAGVVPGPYRFPAVTPGIRTPVGPWWLTSLTIGGREVLDAPLDLRHSVADAVLTFSDQTNELTGLADASGDGAADPYVIVFSADPTRWFFNSRSIAAVRVGESRRYSIKNLPAGEYFVAATVDVDAGEWFDAPFLAQLARQATRVAIGGTEVKTLDVSFGK
jgi:uncharacterized protein (DUF2141 family)